MKKNRVFIPECMDADRTKFELESLILKLQHMCASSKLDITLKIQALMKVQMKLESEFQDALFGDFGKDLDI